MSYKNISWDNFYDNDHKLKNDTNIHTSWRDMFDNYIFNDKRFDKLEDTLNNEIDEKDGDDLYPRPSHVFNAFSLTPLDELKVVFIGQDPYFNSEICNGEKVPQAMGLSFSVPKNIKIPSSLNNIFNNLVKNERIIKKPKHGDLTFWAYQGCLMLNTALTVWDNEKNCHSKLWKFVTDKIIHYISENCNDIVFVLWGNPAYSKV
ncbi:uracil-DNA glycosylase, partial [bacterium]|nr:uracil-DNA glycosylase [bacterium]